MSKNSYTNNTIRKNKGQEIIIENNHFYLITRYFFCL